MPTSREDKPRKTPWSKIMSIADHEADIWSGDIDNTKLPRKELWLSAFRIAFRMGQERMDEGHRGERSDD